MSLIVAMFNPIAMLDRHNSGPIDIHVLLTNSTMIRMPNIEVQSKKKKRKNQFSHFRSSNFYTDIERSAKEFSSQSVSPKLCGSDSVTLTSSVCAGVSPVWSNLNTLLPLTECEMYLWLLHERVGGGISPAGRV